MQAFQQGLRDLGYVEGQNIKIEYRYTDVAAQGHSDLFPRLAAQVIRVTWSVHVTGRKDDDGAGRKRGRDPIRAES